MALTKESLEQEIAALTTQNEETVKLYQDAQATLLRIDGALQFARHMLATLDTPVEGADKAE